jgi:hypothetical protein
MHSWCHMLLFTQTTNFLLLLLNWQKHHSTITIFNYNPSFHPQCNCLTFPFHWCLHTPQQSPHCNTSLQTNLVPMMLVCANIAAVHPNNQLPSLITKSAKTPFHTHNIQLWSPVFPSTQPSHISPLFISTGMPQQCTHCIPSCKWTSCQSMVSYMKYSTNQTPLGVSSRWHSVILKQFVPRSHKILSHDDSLTFSILHLTLAWRLRDCTWIFISTEC